MNIKKRKNTIGNFPQRLKSDVTYPVQDKIEVTLNYEILKLVKKLFWSLKYKEIVIIKTDTKQI